MRLPGTLCYTNTLILLPGFITLVEMDLDSASINLFLYIYIDILLEYAVVTQKDCHSYGGGMVISFIHQFYKS